MLRRHELSDANALKIMCIAIALIVASVVLFLSIAALFFLLKSFGEPKSLPAESQNLISKRKGPLPSILEVKAAAEYKVNLAKERKLLESYQWLDRKEGVVRIPIEQAIEILLYEH